MISASDLARSVNKPLMKELEAARKAERRGDPRQSIAHLRRVVVIDPSFAVAWVNLGVQYVSVGSLSAGRGAFLKAIELDRKLVTAYIDLAITDLTLGDPIGAAEASKVALSMAPANEYARKVLAAATRAGSMP